MSMEDSPGVEESTPASVATRRPARVYTLLGVLLVALVVGAYWIKVRPAPPAQLGAVNASEDATMKAGLDALYTRNDPTAAAVQFFIVLARNPNHYGATFQLATALDRAGRRAEARPYWDKMLAMAEAIRDDGTAATARARLAGVEPAATEDATLKAGLDALYVKKDPNTAAVQFRKVLDRNPSHYGATFQLAKALDGAGKRAEARPLWEKVLKMAEGYKDTQTATTARARLAQHP